MVDAQMPGRRWALTAISPSTLWLSNVSPELIEQQHIKTKKPPLVSIVFGDGIGRGAVRAVAERAEADGAYDVRVESIPWPQSTVEGLDV